MKNDRDPGQHRARRHRRRDCAGRRLQEQDDRGRCDRLLRDRAAAAESPLRGTAERDPDAAHDRPHRRGASFARSGDAREPLQLILSGKPPRYVVNPRGVAGVDRRSGASVRQPRDDDAIGCKRGGPPLPGALRRRPLWPHSGPPHHRGNQLLNARRTDLLHHSVSFDAQQSPKRARRRAGRRRRGPRYRAGRRRPPWRPCTAP